MVGRLRSENIIIFQVLWMRLYVHCHHDTQKSIERFSNTFVPKGDTGDEYTTFQLQSNGTKNGTGYTVNFSGNYSWTN